MGLLVAPMKNGPNAVGPSEAGPPTGGTVEGGSPQRLGSHRGFRHHFLFCFSSFFLAGVLAAGATMGVAAASSTSTFGTVTATTTGFSVP